MQNAFSVGPIPHADVRARRTHREPRELPVRKFCTIKVVTDDALIPVGSRLRFALVSVLHDTGTEFADVHLLY
jgi:hypothetical protein